MRKEKKILFFENMDFYQLRMKILKWIIEIFFSTTRKFWIKKLKILQEKKT